jgi:hypothetical protein
VSFASDEDSYSLRDGRLKLLVELVHTDFVAEILYIFVLSLALHDNGDVQADKDIVVSGASSHRELVNNVLLCHQELNLGPWEAPNEPALILYMIKFTMLGYDGIRPFRPIKE